MTQVDRATDNLRSEAMNGLHTVDRALAACWDSVARIVAPEIMQQGMHEDHDMLRRIEGAAVDVRHALDKAMRELHEASSHIDAIF